MFDVSGPDLGGHWVIQLFSTGISYGMFIFYFLLRNNYTILKQLRFLNNFLLSK